jgi:hypothetical protein
MPRVPRDPWWKRYAYGWVTLILFLVSLSGHWVAGWFVFVGEQAAHGMPIDVGDWALQMTRDTLENWQSEFLQLLWQVGGLALLLYVGSPQSREGSERLEAKLDALLRRIDPDHGEETIRQLDSRFDR